MLKIGSIVHRAENESSRYGVIVEFFAYGRRNLACVHHIDPNTGKLLECPDKARCKNKGHTCPSHCDNIDVEALEAFTTNEINFMVAEELIDTELAR